MANYLIAVSALRLRELRAKRRPLRVNIVKVLRRIDSPSGTAVIAIHSPNLANFNAGIPLFAQRFSILTSSA